MVQLLSSIISLLAESQCLLQLACYIYVICFVYSLSCTEIHCFVQMYLWPRFISVMVERTMIGDQVYYCFILLVSLRIMCACSL